MAFGNIHEQSLMEIWRGKAYVRFRRSFEKGDLADVCQGCPKLSGR
jgi:MoaA/NifB/PqqE/SkfB family radical SAM enzyme